MFDPQKRHLLLLTYLSSWISAVENELSLMRTTITFALFVSFNVINFLNPSPASSTAPQSSAAGHARNANSLESRK